MGTTLAMRQEVSCPIDARARMSLNFLFLSTGDLYTPTRSKKITDMLPETAQKVIFAWYYSELLPTFHLAVNMDLWSMMWNA